MNKRPDISEYSSDYANYIGLIKVDSTIKAIRILEEQTLALQAMLSSVEEDLENYSYADGKWTLKEVIGHMVDTERIFGYRLLRFARGDKSVLPGFDQVEYVKNGGFNKRSLYDLAHEFGFMRSANVFLFKSFDQEIMNKKGIADGKEMSVRAGIFIMAGHTIHHMNSIKAKYLVMV